MQAFFLNTGISIEIQNSVFFHILFSDKTKLCIFPPSFLRQQTFHFYRQFRFDPTKVNKIKKIIFKGLIIISR